MQKIILNLTYQMFLRLGTMMFKMHRDVRRALHVYILGNRFR
jgi:hypothetical protein